MKKFEREFIKYAFVDIIQDHAFSDSFKKCKRKKDKSDFQKEVDATKTARQLKKESRKEERQITKKGYALGIDKVVVVNPYYMKLDFRKRENHVDYLSSEAKESMLSEWIVEAAAATNLDAELIAASTVEYKDAETMNDLMYLSEWFNHQLELEDIEMKGFNQKDILKIADKYGTDHFLWTGIVSGRKKKSIMGFLTFLYLHPAFSAYYLTNPVYESMYFSILIDVRNCEMKMSKVNPIFEIDSKEMVGAHLYDTFLQIKKRSKD